MARLSAASSSACARLMTVYTARSITHSLQSVSASTVAARGALYNSASSPNPLHARRNGSVSKLTPLQPRLVPQKHCRIKQTTMHAACLQAI